MVRESPVKWPGRRRVVVAFPHPPSRGHIVIADNAHRSRPLSGISPFSCRQRDRMAQLKLVQVALRYNKAGELQTDDY